MKLALSEQMQQLDKRVQTEYGLSGDLLMERAALAASEVTADFFPTVTGKKIYICCGKGNNGGDGLALARILAGKGSDVTAVLLYSPPNYQGLAAINLDRATRFGVRTVLWSMELLKELESADLIVDAVLGTGTTGAPREPISQVIGLVNRINKPLLALDLPTGINADTGEIPGEAFRAIRTITFGLAKPGLYCYPGAEYAGEVIIDTIGFPPELLESEDLQIHSLNPEEARRLLPGRKPTAHKGSGGHVLIIGGAFGMTGAPAMTAIGALRAGCGRVTVGLRESVDFLEKPPEVMTMTWDKVIAQKGQYRAVVFGPGLTAVRDGRDLLFQLIETLDQPLIIDADGLNIIAKETGFFGQKKQPWVLTPHPGEMSRLTGLSIPEIQRDRVGVASRYAVTWQAVVVLKGAHTVIALPDGKVYLNLTGNPAMATAGMGDALAGMIGSLIAQGLSADDAGVLGPYLHGLAGDLAVIKRGPVGIITSDLLAAIPAAYKKVYSDE